MSPESGDMSSKTPPPEGTPSHFDPQSGKVRMVDVGEKSVSDRRAVAEGWIRMSKEAFLAVTEGRSVKGDPLATARIAGILAAKKTADLIPLCHPVALTYVGVDILPNPDDCSIRVRCETRTRDRTGVEMEALVAVQIALLTLYDMLKAVDRGMVIGDICLIEKEGGRSGSWKCGTR